MKWLDRLAGNTALSRAERLIAFKLDEIAKVQRAQDADLLGIQARIDDVDTKIARLKRARQRICTEMANAQALNKTRLDQLKAELAELRANLEALECADVVTPASKTMVFRASDRARNYAKPGDDEADYLTGDNV